MRKELWDETEDARLQQRGASVGRGNDAHNSGEERGPPRTNRNGKGHKKSSGRVGASKIDRRWQSPEREEPGLVIVFFFLKRKIQAATVTLLEIA
jgi:hypothetical protein